MKTGILGGTFNPIHFGHLRSAEEVREALGLDQVRFVPLSGPAHKSENDIAPESDRLEMVRIALEDHPFFFCDPIEIERGGISYTIDTLRALADGTCRGHEMYFIIGADAFSLLSTWREPMEVLLNVNFAVTLRGDQTARDVIFKVESSLNEKDVNVNFEEISENRFQPVGFKRHIKFIQVTTLEISSTLIRRIASAGTSLRYLLPPQVEAFIIRRGLYGNKGRATARQ